ncbi:MAG: hypothetical protein HXX08_23450 [Chloroflexi bacterium]|uniref:Big-1 domain-containing protein n=1 Tax=Candidatus Chlorohelix allophototropha TaxID=3003348 RepID=A0A8T7M9X4_9CHLR|nr:hypothetical protein [Chloroflexota bacterium]WJW68758.1 hypothetical protein OZ401_004375 [Chloroflexota bacterium L227-S17]
MRKRLSALIFVFTIASLMFIPISVSVAAPAYGNDKFKQLWQYSDKLVDEVPGAGRGFTWGPNSFGILEEDYQEAPSGKRQVQYFDKSRMEISTDGQFVTNGLLTKELVTGQRQDGNAKFSTLQPSTSQVAGDDNSGGGNAIAPTYASFKNVVTFNPGENTATDKTGKIANLGINREGVVKTLDSVPAQITIGSYESTLGHNIPQVFVDFQNLTGRIWLNSKFVIGRVYTDNPIANVFGYPISEAYWAKAVVAGQERDVLIQLFERRVLTYTPDNPLEFRVEMGNIGQHYFQWRYIQGVANNSASCTGDKPPVSPNLSINASLAQPSISGGNQTLCVAANKNGQPVAGAKVTYSVAYKSKRSDFTGNDTGADGKSSTVWDVGGPTKGFEVKVTVKVTYGSETATTTVSWTPQ